jgi:hypothetical protein
MGHEISETVQGADGRWYNVYGRATPWAGQLLPPTYAFEQHAYPTMQAAEAAATARSRAHGAETRGTHPAGPAVNPRVPAYPPERGRMTLADALAQIRQRRGLRDTMGVRPTPEGTWAPGDAAAGGPSASPGDPAGHPGTEGAGYDPSAVGLLSQLGLLTGLVAPVNPFGLMSQALARGHQIGVVPSYQEFTQPPPPMDVNRGFFTTPMTALPAQRSHMPPGGRVGAVPGVLGISISEDVGFPGESMGQPSTAPVGTVSIGQPTSLGEVGEPGTPSSADPGEGNTGEASGAGSDPGGDAYRRGGVVRDRSRRPGGAEPITAHQGEYVVRAPAETKHRRLLERINRGA